MSGDTGCGVIGAGTVSGDVEWGQQCGVIGWGCWVWGHRCGDMDVGTWMWGHRCGDTELGH